MARPELRRRGEAAKPDASSKLAASVRRALQLDDGATVSVAEIACGEPACGGAETIILVLRPGKPAERIHLKMPAASIGDAELAAALAGGRASDPS